MSQTNANSHRVLLDTSAAVALVLTDHEHHETTVAAALDRERGLAGHAAFETFSVLTRLPPPARRTPGTAHRLIATDFPRTVFLSPGAAAQLLASLPTRRIAGGAVYDALVGAAAAEHGLPLITLDLRAQETYREMGAEVEFLL